MSRPAHLFGATARALHWIMALMILTMLFIGVGMAASVSTRYSLLVSIHQPLGIAVLVLAVMRFLNRLFNPPPPLPADLPAWQALAAKGSHYVLYGLMFIMPLLGWAMRSASPYPVILFGSWHLPPIMPQNATLYAVLRYAHTILGYAFFATVLAHVGAAFFHGLIRRDGVLESMASLQSKEIRDAR